MSNYSTLLTSLQEEAHEPADSSVFARHVKAALYHMRPLVVPWSNTTTTLPLVSGQASYERGTSLPGDVLSFDSVFLLYPSSSDGLNVELTRVTIQRYRRLDVSTTTAVGTPSVYAWYDSKLYVWPKPGTTSQYLQIDYQRDATLDENTGVAFSASSPDNAFSNEYFRRGEEMLRTRALYTYALSRSKDSRDAETEHLLYNEARSSVMRERDMMELEGQQVASYW